MHTEYRFKSNYFSIDGNKIHYLDEGEGPVVVMVHGNPTWSFYYRNLVNALSDTHRVIVVDHIGCGLSDKPQDYDYTLHNHIENLAALLTNLSISSYSLIVHDSGGAIGMGVAAKTPEKIEKVVVLNTAAFRSTKIPFRISLCRIPYVGALLVRGFNGFAWPATFMAVENQLSKETKNAYLAPYDSWGNRVAVHQFVRDIPLDSNHRSYKTLVDVEKGVDKLAKPDTPLLILWGGKDFCFNDHFYKGWCERFPHSEKHYFEDAGHYILEDKRDETKEHVTSFLRKKSIANT